MLAEIPSTQFAAVLDRCADDLLWEAGVSRPPVDAAALAERLGITIASHGVMSERARFVRLAPAARGCGDEWRGDTIVLADEPRPERRQWAIAHEVGEAFASRVFDTLGVDPREAPDTSRERIANALAGRILAPSRWLRGVWRELDGDLLELKRVFSTASHELIARRLIESVPAPLVVTVTDHGQVAWRRWTLSGVAPPRVRLEVDCQRQAHETTEPAWGDGRDEPQPVGPASVDRVRSWPIHEPAWRREITLTDLRSDEPSEWW